ncbi:hypothetical protein BBK14_28880 [Parafrankia soli]|uniref:Winged helix DNA-binding domain-containing protein n=2 Tax=Parafrankia soli TaxID=2599596 RepID=A0A1S1PI84_9ACTN|nr:hypothetical protein BBK14_28880 [Parafrankia soli]
MAGRETAPDEVAPAVAAARLAAQGLAGTAWCTAVDTVAHLLAVQAQDPRGMRLAIRSRVAGSHAADVDEALTTDRSLVVTWLNRGTLHLVRAEDYWWLHPLTAPRMQAQIRRRFTEEGVSPAQAERGVSVVERALAADGPLGRDALRERLRGAGVPVDGQALIYILIEASVRGLVVRGPVAGTWAVRAGRVELTAFAPLSPAVTQALRSEAADVERFLRPAGQQASVSSRRP